jgi:hypothetical protein
MRGDSRFSAQLPIGVSGEICNQTLVANGHLHSLPCPSGWQLMIWHLFMRRLLQAWNVARAVEASLP